jgi:hypothetical protein
MVSLEQCAGSPYMGVHTSIVEVDIFFLKLPLGIRILSPSSP